MRFTRTELEGVWLIDLDTHDDERGFFARCWCRRDFEEHGLNPDIAQCNISFNRKRGTLRGMHYQAPPHEEAKLIRVTRGAVFDVVIDVRPDSATHLQWFSTELSIHDPRMLYISAGFAHGFQTLQDETEVFYQMSAFHCPEVARGIRWNDPALNIPWPVERKIISAQDRSYGDIKTWVT